MSKIKRIDHLAIAVRNSDEALKRFTELLNAEHIKPEILNEKAGPVKVAYIRIGENILSLIQDADNNGFINRHIEKRGEGLHHLGLEVDNLDEFIKNAEKKGYTIAIKDEFSNRREVVLRTKETCGVVMQVIEWTDGSDDTIGDGIKRILDLENL